MPQWITARGSAVPPPPPPPNDPLPIEPEYEVIEFSGQQTYSNQPIIRGKELKEKEKKRCDLCGSSAPAVRCLQCVQQNFCYSCDEMYHRHPKRQAHVRKELEGGGRPPLPPKAGELQPPPVPPPRRNKRATPRPQNSPLPPPVPPSPQISQRDPLSSKTGFMGSLKRMMGGRQLPIVPHGIDHQNQMSVNNPMMGFQDPQMTCNGFQDWSELQRGTRSGSFNTLNSQGFGHMMQSQSMAHLNCPSCQGHPMWNPWGGMPAPGTWQSSAFLNHCPPKDQWSESDSDPEWHRERQRRFSTISARMPRSHGFDDNHSMRGGRRTDVESSSYKGNRRREFDTMSNRGGSKRRDSDTMSLRGGRRNDFSNSLSSSQRKFSNDRKSKHVHDRSDELTRDTESSDKESDEDFLLRRENRAIMSDVEEVRRSRRKSESLFTKQNKAERSKSLRVELKMNEHEADIRRKRSPVNNKYDSPIDDIDNEIKPGGETESEVDDKAINGIGAIGAQEEEEEELGPVPETEWECKHCTFVNQGGTRVCVVCCKTTAKPKLCKPATPTIPPTEDLKNKLNIEDKSTTATPSKTTKEPKEKRGIQSPEQNRILTSKGTSPPPQSISTQTYEEAGRKLKRATSLADYGDWRTPQRSVSRQSLLSDTQSLPVTPPRSRSPEQKKIDINRRPSDQFSQRSLKRSGSQPPEYISSLVQKQVKQGLEMVKLLREAEEHQFSAEDLTVALLHCGDEDPIVWLQENWRNMIDTVVTLGTNYGQERKENIVGTISASEARDALRAHDGNVWAAVTECVEQRQKKYAELLSRGNFSREDIVTVLTAHHGNLEEAYKELNKNQLKPFLMRIWGPPQGAENDDGDITKLAHGEFDRRGGKNSEEVSVDLSIESNYDRIQNWLDHVNYSNKSRFSQSMVQLNLIGANHLESEWKPQTNYKHSDSPNFQKNSDIHRYLTTFYKLNDKSLRIDSKNMYCSMQNLNTSVKTISGNEDSYPEEKSSIKKNVLLKSEKNKNELDSEIETITIKLKPIIVQIEDDDTFNSELNKDESLHSEEKESNNTYQLEHNKSENEKEDDINDEYSYDGKYQNSETSKGYSEKSGFSSEALNVKIERSLDDSETSSESFESLHSEEQNFYENLIIVKDKTNNHDSQAYENIQVHNDHYDIMKEDNDRILKENRKEDQENIVNPISKKTVEEIVTKVDQFEVNSVSFESQTSPTIQSIILENSVIQKDNSIRESENQEQSCNYQEKQIFSVTKESLDIKVTQIIEDYSVGASTIESNFNTSPYKENESDNEENSSESFLSDEMPTDTMEFNEVEKSNYNTKSVIENDLQTLSDDIQQQIEMQSVEEIGDLTILNSHLDNYLNVQKEKNHLSIRSSCSKSDSDINEESIYDFSDQSGDYIEKKISSPVNAEKRDKSSRISDSNSEKDVSSIPSDSEREIIHNNYMDNNNAIESENDSSTNNSFHSSQMELIDLLKKSLTKDEVVERIVSTLFASVWQVSHTETQNAQELGFLKKTLNKAALQKETEQFLEISPSTENSEISPLTENLKIAPSTENLEISPTENLEISPSTDNLEISSSIENLEISPRTESLNLFPSTENLEISPSTESLKIFSSTDNLEISPSTDNLEISSSIENLEISPSTESLKIFPSTENLEILPSTESLKISPSTENLEISPSTDNLEISSSIENLEISPSTESLKIFPSTENLEILPSTESLKILPSTENLEISPSTDNLEISSSIENLEISSSTESLKIFPSTENLEIPPSTESLKILPSTENLENLPSTENLENSLTDNLEISPSIDNLEISSSTENLEISPSTENLENSMSNTISDSGDNLKNKEEITTPISISEEPNAEDNESRALKNHLVNKNTVNEQHESKPIIVQREVRRLLAEGLVKTYDQAELALQLKELNLDEDDDVILAAANECDSLESAIAFIQQECQLCAGKCTVKQMISMLECEHRCCLDCAGNYFTLQITERSINDCICPFCKEPDILHLEEDKILTYFSNLDILLKGLVKENIHELFQRKLRDRTLMQDPNFKWCVKCSSGYIANPRQKRLMCPDCKAITCAKCMKPWEKEHEKMSCDEYKAWLELNDPENQLARHLDENGVTCPNCKSKYILAKGGCMHLTCPYCKHEFCSGCSKPFLMGKKCSLSEYCERLGLHSHHPRNCLFYLRDKEPEELEKLLEDNNVNYKYEDPVDTRRCNVQLLKETPEGLLEGICGFPTLKAGLCRTHYVESLVTAIRNNRVDPVKLLDYGEALQELRRHGKDPPERPPGMSEYNHRQICLKVIEEEIPLE